MRLVVNQKYWSVADKFNIADEAGRPWFQVEGQIFSIGKKLWLKDMEGNEIFFLKQKVFSFVNKWEIQRGGQIIGTFTSKFFHMPFVRTYKLEGEFGKFKIKGSSFGYNFRIFDMNNGDTQVGTISKKILKIADTYVIDIVDEITDPAIAVTGALIVDALHHKKH